MDSAEIPFTNNIQFFILLIVKDFAATYKLQLCSLYAVFVDLEDQFY